jgi:uncharacterized lipoprotein YmbA
LKAGPWHPPSKESDKLNVWSYKLLLGVIATLCFFNLNGCGKTAPTHFYILSSLNQTPPSLDSQRTKILSIGVGPVYLTDHLARSQIVSRSGPNKIIISDFDKWAGSLSSDIPRTLADNLSILLETEKVVLYPWPRTLMVDYQVAINITGFEGGPDEQAVLNVNWIIFSGEEEKVLHIGKRVFQTSVPSAEMAALVGALSRNLAEFSRLIAQMIKELASQAEDSEE